MLTSTLNIYSSIQTSQGKRNKLFLSKMMVKLVIFVLLIISIVVAIPISEKVMILFPMEDLELASTTEFSVESNTTISSVEIDNRFGQEEEVSLHST